MTRAKIAHSIVGSSEGRPAHDFYPTPPGATLALLSVESFDSVIWEPACGDGAISKVLESQGHTVISSDLIDRGYGTSGIDFLLTTKAQAEALITNPPFRLSEDFLVHAQRLGVKKIVLFAKLAFLEGQSRSRLLERTGLSRVWIFRNRVTLTRNGEKMTNGGMIAFAWFVWDGSIGPPRIGWISEVPFLRDNQGRVKAVNQSSFFKKDDT